MYLDIFILARMRPTFPIFPLSVLADFKAKKKKIKFFTAQAKRKHT